MANNKLELVIRPHGAAELLDDREKILWSSDSDDKFREDFPEFLGEDDIDEVLNWLYNQDILTEEEFDLFQDDTYDTIIESLDEESEENEEFDDD
ncbi:MAG: hypothetical protein ACREQ5_29200 [Candidatus Dormibacteria bacterium]